MYYGLQLRRALDSTVVEDCEEVYRRIGIFSMEPDSRQDEIKIDRWEQEMLLPVERTWSGGEGKDLRGYMNESTTNTELCFYFLTI